VAAFFVATRQDAPGDGGWLPPLGTRRPFQDEMSNEEIETRWVEAWGTLLTLWRERYDFACMDPLVRRIIRTRR